MTVDPNELYPTHKVAVEDPVYSTGKDSPKWGLPPRQRAARSRYVTPNPFNLANEVRLEAQRLEKWIGAVAVLQSVTHSQFLVFGWSPTNPPTPDDNVRITYYTDTIATQLYLHPILVNGDPQSTLKIAAATTNFCKRDTARAIWEHVVMNQWKPFLWDSQIP